MESCPMRTRPKIADTAAWGILFLFLAIGFWYSLWNPLGEGVDEGAHFQYVLYLKEHRALPIQPFRDNSRPLLVSMGHHPPLYYALGALVIAGIDTRDAPEVLIPNPHFIWGVDHPRNGWNVYLHTPKEDWPWRGTVLAMHGVRWLTLILGAVALWAVYRTGRLLLPEMPWVAVTGMAWLAFNPSFVFMASAIHHDALMAALFASGLWWLIRLLDRPLTVREGFVGGLLLGGAMLTKLSGLALALVYGLGFLLLAVRIKALRTLLPGIGVTYGTALAVSGWWYIRNLVLYGDPLGWEMFRSISWFIIRPDSFTWDIFVHEFLYQLAQTFWGAFGFMHITLPPTIWWTFWKIAFGLAGIALLAVSLLHRRFLAQGRWARWVIAWGGWLILFAAFVRYATEIAGAGHARYLFPAAAALVTTLAIGCHAIAAFRMQPLVTGLVSLGLIVYAVVIPQRFVIPLYPRPETASEGDLAAASPINLCFGDAVCVRAGHLSPETEASYSLTLYWQALPGQRPDLYAHLQLRHPEGSVLLHSEFWPIPFFSTIAWDPANIYVTRYVVYLPPGTLAGTYTLELSLTAGRGGDPLPAHNADGSQWKDYAPLTDLTMERPVPLTLQMEIRRADELEHGIRLIGYSLEKRTFRPGDTLRLTLFWQPSRTLQPNLVVFVHVLDSQGALIAQHDGVPDEGRRPTPFWQPGTVIRDPHPIVLPSDVAPGEYTISVGMYDWPGLQRLRVVDGPATGEDHITLETIQVEP
ncbi:MAG: ArnT family glycosyltransferase [Anaerolineae bacterium]